MATLRPSVLILGEGITEFYYFQFLSDLYRGIKIAPDYPKHTSMKELEKKIDEGIKMGYSHIFCVVDMDTKETGPERIKYQKIKAKYSGRKPHKGIVCEVSFFETHRCTELFFLYYFVYTSRLYDTQETLIQDLRTHILHYEKTSAFFRRYRRLNSFLEKSGGSLRTAIANADRSVRERTESKRDYTYSELGQLFGRLDRICKSK